MRCTVLRRLCRKMGLAVETVPHAAHAGQVAGLGGLVFELLPTVREVFISITCLAIVSLLYSRGRVRDGNDWCAARGGNLNRTEAAGTSDLTVVAGTRQSSSYFQCPQTSFLPRRHDSLVQSAASVTTPGRPTDRSDDRFPATGPWPRHRPIYHRSSSPQRSDHPARKRDDVGRGETQEGNQQPNQDQRNSPSHFLIDSTSNDRPKRARRDVDHAWPPSVCLGARTRQRWLVNTRPLQGIYR